LIFLGFATFVVGTLYLYLRSNENPAQPRAPMTEQDIKLQWRKLGFFCELDEEKRAWTLTGSRAGLLYFPDLLLGYVNDSKNAIDGEREHYGPYGSLEVMTWREPGFDSQSIRGSLDDLTRLAELVGEKLATAQPGSPINIREEFAPECRYSLLLDVRADGFDPAAADRERLGSAAVPAE
jgi:hypothetical protein